MDLRMTILLQTLPTTSVYMNNIEKQSELVAYIKTLDNVREVNQSEQAAKTLGSINTYCFLCICGSYCDPADHFHFSDQQYQFLLVLLFVRKRSES